MSQGPAIGLWPPPKVLSSDADQDSALAPMVNWVMDKVPASEFQQYENEWFRVTDALASSEHELADAMHDYRSRSANFRFTQVSQALANREHAKEVVHSLMHIIWQKLI